MIHVVFAWPGLPDYAARAIAAVIRSGIARVTVIATRPSVPIKGMEESLGQPVCWVETNDRNISWQSLGIESPDMMFVGGWRVASFNRLVAECRRTSVPVVLMSDNTWKDNAYHRFLDLLRHRIFFRRCYNAVFVPGQSAERYVKFLGYSPDRIRLGLYGIDASLFQLGPKMEQRAKQMMFVGQFIERKNVVGLSTAFARFADDNPQWILQMCGSGPLRDSIAKHPNIVVRNFVQPRELAQMLRSSRVLVLPSLKEHWALVIHEAALSGCALALSDVNGSIPELATQDNSVIFPTGSEPAIEIALREFAEWDAARWEAARLVSYERASHFGPGRFAAVVAEFIDTLQSRSDFS